MIRCEGCKGEVRNIEGRRYTNEKLKEIHDASCPGVLRIAASKRKRDKTEEPT